MSEDDKAGAEEKPQKRKVPPAPLPVRVVGRKGDSALVEWQDGGMLRRAYVPSGAVKEGAVSATTLKRGISYGLPWERLVVLSATAEDVAQRLRARDIWTAEDLRNNAQVALGVLTAAYGVDLAALNRAACEEERE